MKEHHTVSEAVPRGGQELCPLCGGCGPPIETGCKVAGLHNSCIHSVALHSWCQITPFTQSCIMSSEILPPPQIKMWPPQTAAARNAPAQYT